MKHGGFRAIGNKKHNDQRLINKNIAIPIEHLIPNFPVKEANEIRARVRRVSTRIGIIVYLAKEP